LAAGDARRLADQLGLTDDELCLVLGLTPLQLIAGDGDSATATPILLALISEAEEQAGAATLRRWVRTKGRAGVPLDLLTGRDFGGFEDALADLIARGFIIGG
jgi:hypothetical protein